jgi:hypothetical protein
MPRFAPFYPAFLIFLGAVFVACGAFWASWRQTNFNAVAGDLYDPANTRAGLHEVALADLNA